RDLRDALARAVVVRQDEAVAGDEGRRAVRREAEGAETDAVEPRLVRREVVRLAEVIERRLIHGEHPAVVEAAGGDGVVVRDVAGGRGGGGGGRSRGDGRRRGLRRGGRRPRRAAGGDGQR